MLGDQPTMQFRVVEPEPARSTGRRGGSPRNRVHGRHRRPVMDSADHGGADRDGTEHDGVGHGSAYETVPDQ
jgi:hypothetical protein